MGKVAMVVDDSVTMRRMVSKALSDRGFGVLEFKNGKEALEKLPPEGIALIVADINMPEMDGIELLRALRGLPDHKFTPVVILTTEIGPAMREEARAAGASAWISKPFDPEKLDAIVRRIVS